MAHPKPVAIMLMLQNVVQAENAVLRAADQLGVEAPADLIRMADRIRTSRTSQQLARAQ